MSKPMKLAIALIVVIVIGAMLFGILSLTNSILNSSYKSEELVYTVPEAVDLVSTTKIVYTDPKAEFSTPLALYSNEDLKERQTTYLGMEYDKWMPIIEVAIKNHKSITGGLNSAGVPDEDDTLFEGEITTETLSSVGKLSLSDGLCLIGMCDDTTLVFAHGRTFAKKPTVVVVDASEMLLPTSRTKLYSFGDTFSVYLRKGCFSVDETDEYTILYIKG